MQAGEDAAYPEGILASRVPESLQHVPQRSALRVWNLSMVTQEGQGTRREQGLYKGGCIYPHGM